MYINTHIQVLFMESYAVARRIASANNDLHLLNASQEVIIYLYANHITDMSYQPQIPMDIINIDSVLTIIN
jgi:fumarate hydratase class II